MKTQEYCIYCGSALKATNKDYKIHIKNESLEDVHCCSAQCFKQTKEFMAHDDQNRIKLYIVLAVCIVVDLIVMSITKNSNYMYLPMGIMGIALYFWPYLIVRYRSYQNVGIKKTLSNLKTAGLIIAVLSIIFFFFI